MQPKALRNLLLILVVVIYTAGVFSSGILVGWTLPNRYPLGLPGLSQPAAASTPPMSTSQPDQAASRETMAALAGPWGASDLTT